MNFFGNIEAKIDNKGRLFIPIQFRKLLQKQGEEKVVLKKDLYEPCLSLYPCTIWNDELQELKARLNKWDPKHQAILRQYVSDLEIISMDTNGRILIPRPLLDATKIVNDIKLIGVDDKIEIWAKELTKDSFMKPQEFSSALYQVMKNKNE